MPNDVHLRPGTPAKPAVLLTTAWLLAALLLPAGPASARTEGINWSGTTLVPANDAPAGTVLVIRAPVGASLPMVAVQLAGQDLPQISASPSEVRVQLPAQARSGPLTMTNLSNRMTGTVVPEYRVLGVAAAPAVPQQFTSSAWSGSGASSANNPSPSGHAYLLIRAAGDDAPVLFGEDNTRAIQGGFDVSAALECMEFSVALDTGQQGAHGSSQNTGHRVWHPARFVLRVGKSTPWLFDAARTNRNIDLSLLLFHPHHETGVVEQNFQYRLRQGRIVRVRLVKPAVGDPSPAGLPYYVELLVVPNVSEMESTTGGTVMTDDWANYGS
ncbi:MAG: hypothetical protein KF911_02745 [Pseudomonadales bacterium]|nr:hypothetical protein [Pseudomonadales bacterium]